MACTSTCTTMIKPTSAAKVAEAAGAKKKPKMLNISERQYLKTSVQNEVVLVGVLKSVPAQLIGHLFPEREVFWKSLLPEKIGVLVQSAVTKLLTLCDECGSGSSKSTRLYLNWLDYERSLVCKTKKTEGMVVVGLDHDASEDTKRTVITLIMNTVFQYVSQQMANEIEKLSTPAPSASQEVSPSDETALHRICGWALKSVTDNLMKQSKEQSGAGDKLSDYLKLLEALKLPKQHNKHLPQAVQYLDRGGLTFMKFSLMPWMLAIEERMVQYLNPTVYQRYGQKLYEVKYFFNIIINISTFFAFRLPKQLLKWTAFFLVNLLLL